MNLLTKCKICNKSIPVTRSTAEVKRAMHFSLAHPAEFARAVEIKSRVDALKQELFDLTGAHTATFFISKNISAKGGLP
jgi:hypothetical protein